MATAADGTHPTGMHSCYRPQRSCGQGYVFTRVCDSVHNERPVRILLECILVPHQFARSQRSLQSQSGIYCENALLADHLRYVRLCDLNSSVRGRVSSSRKRFWTLPNLYSEVSKPKILLFSYWFFMQIGWREALDTSKP